MKNKERSIEEETDLYEGILTYESLDQYESLLKHLKTKKKDLIRTLRKKEI